MVRSKTLLEAVLPMGLAVCLAGAAASAAAQQKAAPELKYMTPKCASMLDAQRTAPSVVRRQASFAEMQRNYRDQCAEDQAQAQQRWFAEQREASQQKREQESDKKRQELLSANQMQVKSAQCTEMRLALEARKKRPNPSEGDLRDLGLFEARYKDRCKS